MRTLSIRSLMAVVALSTFGLAGIAGAEEAAQECEALFVHNADEISLDGTTLTMKGFSPTVTYFCDRPVRMAGHLSFEEYFSSVSKGKDNFVEDPPNAVVSITHGRDFADIVVTLSTLPTVEGDTLVYSGVEIVDGDLPVNAGPGSLFIDVIGRPLTPVSVAGAHRRAVRRTVRACAAGVACY